ncbi:MAG: reverse transcriptase/maturase family protein [Paludibacter sp.]|nr:reverse transcriptase/maturase family protein [Paludibacter sp.]
MKRINNLFDQIVTIENLTLAYHKARKGKSGQYGVKIFEKNAERNIQHLYDELISGIYKTSEYSIFKIYDPKEREIYRLPFNDRVVHHAIMNILEPVWTSLFIHHTYSCIKGRGIHAVLNDLKRDLNDAENTKYCLKIDIRKFYPSIDHDILKAIVRKKIKDNRLLVLLDGIIESAPGVPIGNYLSQFLANLYLTYFDHWIKEEIKVKYYYRYADDIVILASNKDDLRHIFNEMNIYLNLMLKLEIKKNYQIFPVASRGVDFVGYVFRHSHILMRKSIKKSLCRKAARLNKMNMSTKNYRILISPWLGWASHCNSKHLIKKVINNEKVFRFGNKAQG